MSEPTEPTTPVVEPEAAPKPAEPAATGAPIELPADHPLVKTLAAQKEQLRELKDKAKRLDDIEDAARTDLERAIARAEAAEKAVAERDAKDAAVQLVKDVADEKGLADRGIPSDALRGTTREELEAHADVLLALVPAKPKAPSADGQGKTGDPIGSVAQITSRDQLKSMSPEQIDAARKDGRLDSLMGK